MTTQSQPLDIVAFVVTLTGLLFWAPLGTSKSVPAGGSPLTFA